jgi:hypothetical protein
MFHLCFRTCFKFRFDGARWDEGDRPFGDCSRNGAKEARATTIVEAVRAAEEMRATFGVPLAVKRGGRGGLSFLWFRRKEMRRQRSEFRFLSLTISSSPDNCTSPFMVSRTNNANAGGHSTITTSTAVGGGGDGGGVLGIETRAGGRSVGTSELDDESETIKVEEASGLNERR